MRGDTIEKVCVCVFVGRASALLLVVERGEAWAPWLVCPLVQSQGAQIHKRDGRRRRVLTAVVVRAAAAHDHRAEEMKPLLFTSGGQRERERERHSESESADTTTIFMAVLWAQTHTHKTMQLKRNLSLLLWPLLGLLLLQFVSVRVVCSVWTRFKPRARRYAKKEFGERRGGASPLPLAGAGPRDPNPNPKRPHQFITHRRQWRHRIRCARTSSSRRNFSNWSNFVSLACSITPIFSLTNSLASTGVVSSSSSGPCSSFVRAARAQDSHFHNRNLL